MTAPQRTWTALALLAVALPPLAAYNEAPSSTFYNQALALLGWGAWLLAAAAALPRLRAVAGRGPWLLLAALALLAVAAAITPLWTAQPASLALPAVALLAAAMLAVTVGAALRAADLAEPAFSALAWGLLGAALGSALVGVVQVFAPALSEGGWIAASATPGRAVGNLRQPNHLASLLLWGLIAAVWLAQARRLRGRWALACGVLMVLGVVLSASRTGIVGALLLALWGGVDRRLAPRARIALLATPLLYGVLWLLLRTSADLQGAAFAGAARLTAGGDLSSSRFAIWSDTLVLIGRVPWTGTGFGEFNFAWTLTPLPDRPGAFFDHTHNLPLQLLVELGVPLGLLVLALLGAALVAAWRQVRSEPGAAPAGRAALALVVMIGVHSLLEYPLWYAYFLLPAAFAFGLALGAPAAPARAASSAPRLVLPAAALLLLVGALFSIYDYRRVAAVFAAPAGAPPLAERIADGQRSVFFAHHAHYAAATLAEQPGRAMAAFAGATHFLLDTRLTIAWARGWHERGDAARALHLADRLREFANPDADAFFAPCADAVTADAPRFPCAAAPRPLDWRDFR